MKTIIGILVYALLIANAYSVIRYAWEVYKLRTEAALIRAHKLLINAAINVDKNETKN